MLWPLVEGFASCLAVQGPHHSIPVGRAEGGSSLALAGRGGGGHHILLLAFVTALWVFRNRLSTSVRTREEKHLPVF